MRTRLALALIATLAAVPARADDGSAGAAIKAAALRAEADPRGALDDFEAIGKERPVTRWTDNAWEEAARLAEAQEDFARARRDYQHAIDDGTDQQLVRRAKASLERLAQTGGAQFDAATREYDALRAELSAPGDPRPAIAKLEAFVRANGGYPRVNSARLALARAHELEGNWTAAIAWAREATAHAGDEPGQATRLELVRTLIRARVLADAQAELDAMARDSRVDQPARGFLVSTLEKAERRQWLRRIAWLLLALLAGAAVWLTRRTTGTWRATARAFLRPPTELLFMAPFAALLVAVAATGNPLVARAVAAIAIGGLIIAWGSGTLLGARGPRRVAVHMLATCVAVGCVAYLAVEHGVLDLLIETWRGGHALP
ncbi:MAG TPA: tetratricopeptide repeat protein [Kofleriaceae bacterium]